MYVILCITCYNVLFRVCVNYFSFFCVQIPDMEQHKGKEIYFGLQFEVHLDREGLMAEAWSNWSHCTHSQKAECKENVGLAENP